MHDFHAFRQNCRNLIIEVVKLILFFSLHVFCEKIIAQKKLAYTKNTTSLTCFLDSLFCSFVRCLYFFLLRTNEIFSSSLVFFRANLSFLVTFLFLAKQEFCVFTQMSIETVNETKWKARKQEPYKKTYQLRLEVCSMFEDSKSSNRTRIFFARLSSFAFFLSSSTSATFCCSIFTHILLFSLSNIRLYRHT